MSDAEVDIGQLSESQQLALQQYTSVTDQDIQAAIPLLQRSQWNVQIAIAKFFDGETADPVAEALAAQNVPPARTSRQENLQESLLRGSSPYSSRARDRPDAAPRIVPQPENQVIRQPPLLLSIFLTPFNLLYKILSTSLGFFAYLFPFLPRLFRPTAAGRRSRNTIGRRSLNPRDTSARFKREFEEQYGPHSLPFFETGGYAQALDLAKKDLKFLLIVLLSPEHDDTSAFVYDTLLSEEVAIFINDPANNIILWGGNIQDSEAYQVSAALRCTKFPFAALITHTPREGSTAMSVVARIGGLVPQSTFIAKLQAGIAAYSEQLATVRSARSAQNFERTLRQEQDSAYERSLAQDRERARLRKEAEAAAAEAEKKAAEAEIAEKLRLEKLESWKKWRAARILPEPAADDKESVRIAIRMPESAVRVARRFSGTADIEELYAFVECYEVLKADEISEKIQDPEVEHEYGFKLVSPVPRMVCELSDGGSIAQRIGRSGNLIVEPVLEDEEDEEE